jgi:hypothetical protein
LIFLAIGAEFDSGTLLHTLLIQTFNARQKQRGAAGAEKEFFVLRRRGAIYWLSAICLAPKFLIRKNCVAEISRAQKLRTQKF